MDKPKELMKLEFISPKEGDEMIIGKEFLIQWKPSPHVYQFENMDIILIETISPVKERSSTIGYVSHGEPTTSFLYTPPKGLNLSSRYRLLFKVTGGGDFSFASELFDIRTR